LRTAADLDADQRAPRAARDLVRGMALQAGCVDERVGQAALLASELVTNAVLHGRTDRVRVELDVDALAVRVAVHDRSPERPVPHDPDPDRLYGRGLLLVDRLAEAWGIEVHPAPPDEGGGGKAVWFRVPCR